MIWLGTRLRGVKPRGETNACFARTMKSTSSGFWGNCTCNISSDIRRARRSGLGGPPERLATSWRAFQVIGTPLFCNIFAQTRGSMRRMSDLEDWWAHKSLGKWKLCVLFFAILETFSNGRAGKVLTYPPGWTWLSPMCDGHVSRTPQRQSIDTSVQQKSSASPRNHAPFQTKQACTHFVRTIDGK